jgi:hypothetical protein
VSPIFDAQSDIHIRRHGSSTRKAPAKSSSGNRYFHVKKTFKQKLLPRFPKDAAGQLSRMVLCGWVIRPLKASLTGTSTSGICFRNHRRYTAYSCHKMDQTFHAIAIAEQEAQAAVSQLHDAVAIAIGQFCPINNQVKFKNGISFLTKMKVR